MSALTGCRAAIHGAEVRAFGPQGVAGFHKLRARSAGSRRYVDLHVQFVAGTTLGMLCADLPAVLLGNAVRSLPFRAVRLSAAALFVALGAAVLLGHFALA